MKFEVEGQRMLMLMDLVGRIYGGWFKEGRCASSIKVDSCR